VKAKGRRSSIRDPQPAQWSACGRLKPGEHCRSCGEVLRGPAAPRVRECRRPWLGFVRSPLDPWPPMRWKAKSSKKLCGDQGDGFRGGLPCGTVALGAHLGPMHRHLCALTRSTTAPRWRANLFDSLGRPGSAPLVITDVFRRSPRPETGGGSGEGHHPDTPLSHISSGVPGCWSAWLNHRVDFISRCDCEPWIWRWRLPACRKHSVCSGQVESGAVVWHPEAMPRPGGDTVLKAKGPAPHASTSARNPAAPRRECPGVL